MKNPIIWSDYPDVDVIRVNDTYYMVSTTMHFMPGCAILRSYDLMHWEMAAYVYETLDHTPGQCLEDGIGIYGKGMWAASLRWHEGRFYVCFVANDTGKTYLYVAEQIEGPWKKQQIEGFYHDCSLLFEEGHTYIVYGNRQIYLTELNESLTAPKEGGLHRLLLEDTEEYGLGFEGSHIYKINGNYYLFLIHWAAKENGRRQEACYWAASLTGSFEGRNVTDDDLGFHNQGVAQGGIVDTPWGDWYAMLFQDHGAVGRIPVLMPVCFENGFPVFGKDGKLPREVEVQSTRPEYVYQPLFSSDSFAAEENVLSKVWQWNHEPDSALWSLTERKGWLRITTNRVVPNVVKAKNTLTQRTFGPVSTAGVTVDASGLKEGDYLGISAFQNHYGMIAVTKENNRFYVVMLKRSKEEEDTAWHLVDDRKPGVECGRAAWNAPVASLKIVCDFEDMRDTAEFFYRNTEGEWERLGEKLEMHFDLAHFNGYRYALSCFSTKQAGGHGDFSRFEYQIVE